ncbi:MAG: hypothetical protein E7256_15925 [Lachnospiraceae bacterium]|nr:hypothetical protein [Lachnospiraceae bacterium]
MLAVLYLVLCFLLGYGLCSVVFPNLKNITGSRFSGEKLSLCSYFVQVPAWYLTGTVAMTWLTYLFAYAFKSKEKPLIYGNLGSMIVGGLLIVLLLWLSLRKHGKKTERQNMAWSELKKISVGEYVLMFLSLFLIIQLMWITFHVKNGELQVGYSVFSDFSPHLGMIRSFSYGNNFPTQYSHFAGEDIRYHFLFQFLVGNLEFLGMRIDYAFNIPSALSLFAAVMLLYVLAVKIGGKRSVGYLTCLFFAFRSSKSLFIFLSKVPEGTSLLAALKDNTEFIGYTTNEAWGLWNLNVYCNQRHLALGLAVMLLILLFFIPHLYALFERVKAAIEQREKEESTFAVAVREIFFTKEGWMIKDLGLCVAAGILLGILAFFNGAVTIAALLILFLIAVFADRRLEFLVTAVIATGLSVLQSSFFIKGSAISTSFYFGFIAENRTFFGVIDYIERLLGILPIVLLVAFLLSKGVEKWLMACVSLPFLFAFTMSLTVDVTVNHKYIMISVMLAGIFAAIAIVKLYEKRSVFLKAVCILLTVVLTATGLYDYTIVLKKNQNSLNFDLDDPLTLWIRDNADSKDIFLSSNYALNNVVMGGAMLFLGWPYFGWSAGYDTAHRAELVKEMYEADSSEELMQLVEENNIRFIIVDYDNRVSMDYNLDPYTIPATYEAVYESGAGDYQITIYDTKKAIGR